MKAVASMEMPPTGPWLDFLWLELTTRCNLQCVHCYTSSSPVHPLHRKLTTADWRRLIGDAAAAGCRKLQFIGGEPTLHPALPELLRHAHRHGFELIEVFTNGTGLGKRLRTALVECGAALAFSVYADSAAPHDAVTRTAGSFARTAANLRWARAAGLPVRVGIIGVDADEAALQSALRFVNRELGVERITVDRVRAVGRGADACGTEAAPDLCGHCWRGRLCITSDGMAYPCVFARTNPVGSTDDGLAAILAGTALGGFRRALHARVRGAEDTEHADHHLGCGPTFPHCVPLGDPCSPEEGRRCLPVGGRPCIPQGGACSPESPFCVPQGGLPPCGPDARISGVEHPQSG